VFNLADELQARNSSHIELVINNLNLMQEVLKKHEIKLKHKLKCILNRFAFDFIIINLKMQNILISFASIIAECFGIKESKFEELHGSGTNVSYFSKSIAGRHYPDYRYLW
jgi:hypothetical protein